jgi:hypothetical protein
MSLDTMFTRITRFLALSLYTSVQRPGPNYHLQTRPECSPPIASFRASLRHTTTILSPPPTVNFVMNLTSEADHLASPVKRISDQLAPAKPGTRHITMWENDSRSSRIVKFVNVPDAYDLRSVKHADYVGMFWDFENGETWLTLDNKRLFASPNYGDAIITPGAGLPDDMAIMGPEELQLALQSRRSLEDCHARLEAAKARARAARTTPGAADCQALHCTNRD